ncbi:uncharacterized protein LOC143220074 [Lasioglossum baleicum]|uniref:uncharacterized protein LOC143219542 n=1 Tax=Lasioglossum baleicum TaxID=434251 RepID=UPI003FCD0258
MGSVPAKSEKNHSLPTDLHNLKIEHVETATKETVENITENAMDGINKPEPLQLEGNLAENWRRFKRDFDLFMIATGRRAKAKAVQAATLLNLVGSEALEVFETLGIPEEDKEDPEKIIAAFQNYVEPQRNETYERFLFNSRNRQEGETIEHYIADLKKLVKHCNYGALADSMIRDNIIYHMSDTGTQQKALRSQDLQLDVLIKMIKTHEITKSQTSELQGNNTQKINAIQNTSGRGGKDGQRGTRRERPAHRSRTGTPGRYRRRSTSREKKVFKCRKCNGTHGPRQCPAYGVRCEKCSKYNHTAQACRASECGRDRYREEAYSDSESDFSISTLKIDNVRCAAAQRKDWQEELEIKDSMRRFKIDTGADTNVIPYKMCCELGIEQAIKKQSITLEAYGGFKIAALGTIRISCRYKRNNYTLKFTVIKGEVEPLIGLEACRELGIVNVVHKITEIDSKTEQFIKRNEDIFTGLGEFPGTCDIKVQADKRPIAKPPRRVPKTIKDKLGEQLKSLEKQGIISAYENPSSWAQLWKSMTNV